MNKKPKAEWDRIAEWWDKEAGEQGVWHQQHDIDPVVFELLGNVKGKKVLEIGCGNGYFARILAKKRAKVTATDLSKKFIALATNRDKEKPLGIKYLVRDAARLKGIKGKSFDVVIANMCLMDIADAEKATKEAARVLRKNGRFVFSINHPYFLNPHQQWVITTEKGKKHFSRATSKYLSSSAERHELWVKDATGIYYYRSVETYLGYLRNAGFLVNDFREVATKKKVKKATKADGNIKLRRSRYKTIAEKRMKELAGKELPLFLVVGATRK